jgi:hypothetical protein
MGREATSVWPLSLGVALTPQALKRRQARDARQEAPGAHSAAQAGPAKIGVGGRSGLLSTLSWVSPAGSAAVPVGLGASAPVPRPCIGLRPDGSSVVCSSSALSRGLLEVRVVEDAVHELDLRPA